MPRQKDAGERKILRQRELGRMARQGAWGSAGRSSPPQCAANVRTTLDHLRSYESGVGSRWLSTAALHNVESWRWRYGGNLVFAAMSSGRPFWSAMEWLATVQRQNSNAITPAAVAASKWGWQIDSEGADLATNNVVCPSNTYPLCSSSIKYAKQHNALLLGGKLCWNLHGYFENSGLFGC